MAIAFLIFFYTLYVEKATISFSYKKATGTSCPRNAYRWILKLKQNIPKIITYLKPGLSFHSIKKHVQVFNDLLTVHPKSPFSDFQLIYQVKIFKFT